MPVQPRRQISHSAWGQSLIFFESDPLTTHFDCMRQKLPTVQFWDSHEDWLAKGGFGEAGQIDTAASAPSRRPDTASGEIVETMCRAKESAPKWCKWSQRTWKLSPNHRIFPHFEISKLLALISDQATTEYNSLLALTEMCIDETTVQSLFHIVAQHLSECCGYRFAVGCSINGTSSSADVADHLRYQTWRIHLVDNWRIR